MTITHRQRQIACGLFAEMQPKQIADRLGITVKCVEWHWLKLKRNTGIRTVQGLVLAMCLGRLSA